MRSSIVFLGIALLSAQPASAQHRIGKAHDPHGFSRFDSRYDANYWQRVRSLRDNQQQETQSLANPGASYRSSSSRSPIYVPRRSSRAIGRAIGLVIGVVVLALGLVFKLLALLFSPFTSRPRETTPQRDEAFREWMHKADKS